MRAIWFITYKLKKNASVADFLLASKKCHDEVLSRQKGFVSWEVLRDGETWVDLVQWASAEDARNGETAGANNPVSRAFYSFINMNSCTLQLYTVEKSHEPAT